MPSRPQVEGSEATHSFASVGGRPAGTRAHWPRESGSEHDLHLSVQLDSQHTPSTQKLLWHSLSQAQGSELGRLPVAPTVVHLTAMVPESVEASAPPSLWEDAGLLEEPHAAPRVSNTKAAAAERGTPRERARDETREPPYDCNRLVTTRSSRGRKK